MGADGRDERLRDAVCFAFDEFLKDPIGADLDATSRQSTSYASTGASGSRRRARGSQTRSTQPRYACGLANRCA
jgi:hypothetical protein